jgi:hypothetical protein
MGDYARDLGHIWAPQQYRYMTLNKLPTCPEHSASSLQWEHIALTLLVRKGRAGKHKMPITSV